MGDVDLYLLAEGSHRRVWDVLGAHPEVRGGVEGVRFAVWAPHARRVSVVGDFCDWDGRRHPMRSRGSSGVWELFVPGLGPGTLYKFELLNREHDELLVKTDPYGRRFEFRPATAAVVATAKATTATAICSVNQPPDGAEAPRSPAPLQIAAKLPKTTR